MKTYTEEPGETINNHAVPIAAAINAAKIRPLSDGKMGASAERAKRIIAVRAAVSFWTLEN